MIAIAVKIKTLNNQWIILYQSEIQNYFFRPELLILLEMLLNLVQSSTKLSLPCFQIAACSDVGVSTVDSDYCSRPHSYILE